jgi:hypothetical protein
VVQARNTTFLRRKEARLAGAEACLAHGVSNFFRKQATKLSIGMKVTPIAAKVISCADVTAGSKSVAKFIASVGEHIPSAGKISSVAESVVNRLTMLSLPDLPRSILGEMVPDLPSINPPDTDLTVIGDVVPDSFMAASRSFTARMIDQHRQAMLERVGKKVVDEVVDHGVAEALRPIEKIENRFEVISKHMESVMGEDGVACANALKTIVETRSSDCMESVTQGATRVINCVKEGAYFVWDKTVVKCLSPPKK